MSKLRLFLRTARAPTAALSSRSFMPPPPSVFSPQAGYEDRAKPFFRFDEIQKDVFKTSHLTTSRQGSAKAAFGGLIFSQAMAAAEQTVPKSLKPHAIHSFFILNVDTKVPVEYRVRRTRDGRSFCTRSVEALQNEKVAFTMEISFHKVEPDSIVHQSPMPAVPHWSELSCSRDAVPWLIKKVKEEGIVLPKAVDYYLHRYDAKAVGEEDLFEMRPTDFARHYGFSKDYSRTMYFWFRANGNLTTDCEKLHRYLITYNTDSTMAGATYRPHFVNNFCPTMIFSLDHNVWIHRHDVRADQWHLFEVTSTYAGGSRGFSEARLFTEDGHLVLSCTQEALVRSRDDVSRL